MLEVGGPQPCPAPCHAPMLTPAQPSSTIGGYCDHWGHHGDTLPAGHRQWNARLAFYSHQEQNCCYHSSVGGECALHRSYSCSIMSPPHQPPPDVATCHESTCNVTTASVCAHPPVLVRTQPWPPHRTNLEDFIRILG